MKMKKIIQELISNNSISAMKLDLSSEVIVQDELFAYSKFAKEVNLPLNVKIGGCDALTDIYLAKEIGAAVILSPMIETPYALKKFVSNCKKIYYDSFDRVNLYINIETIDAYRNIDSILDSDDACYISGIVFGRDDMAKSSDIDLKNINSQGMLSLVQDIAEKAFSHNKKFIVGGQIRPDAVPFLNKISKEKLTGYETRRLVFTLNNKIDNIDNIDKTAIIKAIEFEIEWLNSVKTILNESITGERIKELKGCLYEFCC